MLENRIYSKNGYKHEFYVSIYIYIFTRHSKYIDKHHR